MIIYVASPFQISSGHREALESRYSPQVLESLVQWRIDAVVRITAELQYAAYHEHKQILFWSPIAASTQLLDDINLHKRKPRLDMMLKDHDYWMHLDHTMLTVADGLVIAEIPGWTASRGLNEELETFSHLIGGYVATCCAMNTVPTAGTISTINDALAHLDAKAVPNRYCLRRYSNAFDLVKEIKWPR